MHNSHIGRFVETTKGYDWANPLEAVAGVTHVATSLGGIDPLMRDALRGVDGSTVPIQAYSGHFARTRDNIRGLVGNVVHLKPLSAVGSVLNAVGDVASDFADSASGAAQRRGEGYSLAA